MLPGAAAGRAAGPATLPGRFVPAKQAPSKHAAALHKAAHCIIGERTSEHSE